MINATTSITGTADATNIPSNSGVINYWNMNEFQDKYRPMECDDFLAATAHMNTELFAHTKHSRKRINDEEIKKVEMDLDAQIDELKVFMRILGKDWQKTDLTNIVETVVEIVQRSCGIPDDQVPKLEEFLGEFRHAVDATETLVFTTDVVSYEKKLTKLKQRYQALYAKESLMGACNKFAPAKRQLEQRIDRAQLKTDCYQKWHKMNTLKIKVRALKKCVAEIREKIWNNIIRVYINQMESVRPCRMLRDDAFEIIDIYTTFKSVSNSDSCHFFAWLLEHVEKDLSVNSSTDESTSSTTPTTSTPSSLSDVDCDEKPSVLVAEAPVPHSESSVSRKRNANAEENQPAKRCPLEGNLEADDSIIPLQFYNPQILAMIRFVSEHLKNSSCSPAIHLPTIVNPQLPLIFGRLFPNCDPALVHMLCSTDKIHMFAYLLAIKNTPAASITPFLHGNNLVLLYVLESTPQLRPFFNFERFVQWVYHPLFQKPNLNQ